MTEDLHRPTDHQRESANPGFDDHSVWDLPGRGALGAADDKMIGNRLDGRRQSPPAAADGHWGQLQKRGPGHF